jgi:hypothetical protein
MTTGIRDLLAVCAIAMTGLAVSLGFALVPGASTDLAMFLAQVAG